MKNKYLYIILGIIVAICVFIVGLLLADVNVLGALTSSTAILIYFILTIAIIGLLISHFTRK